MQIQWNMLENCRKFKTHHTLSLNRFKTYENAFWSKLYFQTGNHDILTSNWPIMLKFTTHIRWTIFNCVSSIKSKYWFFLFLLYRIYWKEKSRKNWIRRLAYWNFIKINVDKFACRSHNTHTDWESSFFIEIHGTSATLIASYS